MGSIVLPSSYMGQPVKISDQLLLDARLTAQVLNRSIAGQIEYWANLGRTVEPFLRGDKVLALAQAGKAKPLSDCLRDVDSPKGRKRVLKHLDAQPFPHYEGASQHPGLLIRIDANGKRTLGRFVRRKFEAVKLK